MEVVTDFLFLGSKITADSDYSHEIRRQFLLGRKAMTNLEVCWKAEILLCWQRSIQSRLWSSKWMWELFHKEGRRPKNWYLWTVVLEKIPESPLDKEIKPVNLKANQPWMFIERTDAEASVFWSPDENSWLIGKVPDAEKDSGQKEKRVSEDEMAWWHHQCNGRELQQTSRSGVGQGGLARCSPWGETWLADWTTAELLNNWTTS